MLAAVVIALAGAAMVGFLGTRLGLSIRATGVLVTTGGMSLGFAKAAGGMLKNHYPKGLRIQGG